ncbi:MAG: protein BatD [Saprospiraceae bacterium]|nr:protein BatD [Saprospiraceae bacterium]
MFRSFLATLFLLAAMISQAQNVRFYAETESKQVPADGYFELYFKVENGIGKDIQPPAMNDFTILGGPNYSSQTSIDNGKVNKSCTFTYVLQPKSTGTFQIGSATVTVDGKSYTSAPVQVEVVKAVMPTGLAERAKHGEEVFVQMEVDQKEPYVGQQVILDYVIYSRINITTYRFESESKYNGAFAKPFANFDAGAKMRNINGYQYQRRVIRRIALFPQQSGNLRIDPAVITLGIPMEDDIFGALLSSTRPKQVRTNSLDLNIKALPQPAPKNFLGTVGQFEYEVTCDKNKLSTDDAAMLSFKISGNGDLKTIQAPTMQSDENMDFYPPEVLEDTEEERSGEFIGSKTYVVDVTPKKAGNFEIKVPDFVYFDPKQHSYKTLSVEPLPITVTQGNEKPIDKDTPLAVTKESIPFFSRYKTTILAGAGIILLSLIGFIAFKRKKDTFEEKGIVQEKPVEPVIVPDNSALENVTPPLEPSVDEQLNEAENTLTTGDIRSSLRRLYNILTGQLSKHFDIPLSRFNVDIVREKLIEEAVSSYLSDLIIRTLNTLEASSYGALPPGIDAEALFRDVREINDAISKTEGW